VATRTALTKQELIERAEALVPTLAARARQTEDARRLLPETVEDILAAGLNRIANPERYGGYGLDYDTVWEVGRTLGRGCGSTAWVYMVAQIHNWQVGASPEQAQEEYYASPDVWSSSAFAPTGTCERVDGGWLIHGRWPFSSGVDLSDWALFGAFVPERHGVLLLMVPRSDYEIEDDWYVSGLRGTGSKTVLVEQPTFVPEHRWVLASGGPQPAAREAHDRPSYGAPFMSLLPFTLVAPLVGMAEGMVEAFVDRGRTRRTMTGQPQAELVAQQLRVAEASARVDAAIKIARADIAELIERGGRGDEFTVEDRARFRRDHGFVARLCVEAANVVFDASGGNALYDSSAIQRFHRDIHAGSHQVALGWDAIAELYGRARFGLELAPGMW